MSGRDMFYSLVALFAFAVAQPLLDVIGRAPNFFATHDFTRLDIALFAVGLALALPVAAAAVVVGVSRMNRRAGAALHTAAFGILASALALQIAKQAAPSAEPLILIGGAVIGGVAASLAYVRARPVRDAVRWGSAGSVLFLAAFLFLSPTTEVLFPRMAAATAQTRQVTIPNPAPVVLIVFDELPLTSLMKPDYTIDSDAFPHFARLAADGTWFRNATAVHDFTNQAIPAILSGRIPTREIVFPSDANYPDNLFSLLAGTYTINAFETATLLCADDTCRETSAPLPVAARWEGFLRDVAVVSQHVLLPARLTENLPPVDETLGNFAATDSEELVDAEIDEDRRDLRRQRARNRDPLLRWEAFTASIKRSARPSLYFLHTMLTHRPWLYVPSGQRYRLPGNTPGKVGDFWNDDEWLVTQAEQRHLMQVAFSDTLLGEALARLEAEGLYDEALIVVTADHGMSFSTGESLRRVHPQTVHEIAPIPLIVKRPGQKSGTIDDRLVSSVDILPSIADVLGMTLHYRVDGRSLFDSNAAPREAVEIIGLDAGPITVTSDGRAKLPSLERKVHRFAPGAEGFYRAAPDGFRDLLGTPSPPAAATASGSAAVNRLAQFDDVRPDSRELPAVASGTVTGLGEGPHMLAFALNGTVVSVTRTFTREGKPFFAAVLPPRHFRAGRNTLEIYLVVRNGTTHKLERLTLTAT